MGKIELLVIFHYGYYSSAVNLPCWSSRIWMITLKHDTHHFFLHGKRKALETRLICRLFLSLGIGFYCSSWVTCNWRIFLKLRFFVGCCYFWQTDSQLFQGEKCLKDKFVIAALLKRTFFFNLPCVRKSTACLKHQCYLGKKRLLCDHTCGRFFSSLSFCQDVVTQGAPDSSWLDSSDSGEFWSSCLAKYSLWVIWFSCVREYIE